MTDITIQDILENAENSIKENTERYKKGIAMQCRKVDELAYLDKIGVGRDVKRIRKDGEDA